MTTSDDQTTVRARVATPLRDEAAKILKGKGLTVSDVLRETLLRVIERRDVPFPVRNPTGRIVDESRSVARVNYDAGMKLLPELHETRWAERNGELMRERTKARAAGDEGRVEELRVAILDHQKARYDTSGTRELIEVQYRRELANEQIKEFSVRLKESEKTFARLAEQARGLVADITEVTGRAFDAVASGSITPVTPKRRHARHR
jgi:antitoxin component of RelBE/YafQ-DinJ toxin-antitoxin module